MTGKKTRSIPLMILSALLILLLLAFLYLVLIIGHPQTDEDQDLPVQPLLTASPEMNASSENALHGLIASFPVPVMSVMSGSGYSFDSAVSTDFKTGDGFGRMLKAVWRSPEGETVRLDSIYPADSLGLIGRQDYHFSDISGPTLFGTGSVRMENASSIRLHTRTREGLYVVTVPLSMSDKLPALCKSLQLYTAQ